MTRTRQEEGLIEKRSKRGEDEVKRGRKERLEGKGEGRDEKFKMWNNR